MTVMDPALERSFRGHKDVVTSLSFKPNMAQLASGSLDNSVMVWNFRPQLRAFRFVGHKGSVTSVNFSPTGQLLASSSRDNTVRLWTPNVKGDVTVFKAHTSAVRFVQFSSDSESLVTGSDDKTLKLWSVHRTKFQFTLAGHLNWVRSGCFSPDARLVVSGSDDKTVKLWDLSSKSCVKTYYDHTGMVTSVAFHPSGTLIATASTDRSINLFDIRTHKLIQHYSNTHLLDSAAGNEVSWPCPGTPNSIAFDNSSGDFLISTGMDGLVKIWDLKEGHLFYTLHGHRLGPTTAAVFSPEGDFFATGGSDSNILVWRCNFDRALKSIEASERKSNSPSRTSATRADIFPRPSNKNGAISDVEIVSGKPALTKKDPVADAAVGTSSRPVSRRGQSPGRTADPGDFYNRNTEPNPKIIDVGAPLLADDMPGPGENF
ncbi:POC1 centriolar protein A [Phlyctochytrium bullatum]|nr:POC1 centriolar protein A [Phlyctochytrium bullatum]